MGVLVYLWQYKIAPAPARLPLSERSAQNNPIFSPYTGAKFAFDIYDFEGKSRMDLFYLGDCLRGLNLNPTLKMIDKLGGTKKKGEKYIKLEEVERRLGCGFLDLDKIQHLRRVSDEVIAAKNRV
jgi:hypothetical protein